MQTKALYFYNSLTFLQFGYPGYTIAALRDVPFAMVYFLTYELAKALQKLYFKVSVIPYNATTTIQKGLTN